MSDWHALVADSFLALQWYTNATPLQRFLVTTVYFFWNKFLRLQFILKKKQSRYRTVTLWRCNCVAFLCGFMYHAVMCNAFFRIMRYVLTQFNHVILYSLLAFSLDLEWLAEHITFKSTRIISYNMSYSYNTIFLQYSLIPINMCYSYKIPITLFFNFWKTVTKTARYTKFKSEFMLWICSKNLNKTLKLSFFD